MRVTERVHIVKLLTQCMCDSVKIMSTRRVNIVYMWLPYSGDRVLHGVFPGFPHCITAMTNILNEVKQEQLGNQVEWK